MGVTQAKRLDERDGEMGEGSLAFTVSSEVQPDALAAAIREQTGERVAITVEGDTLWVHGQCDAAALRKAIKAAGSQPKTAAESPLASLLAKPEDEPYTDDEMQRAVRLLLKRLGG